MGFQPEYLAFIEWALERTEIVTGRMVELGNQHLRGLARQHGHTGKDYFAGRFDHVSLDQNGCDGARVVNLGAPLPTDLVGQFDVLTNSGTSEHVADQYQVWVNMHALLRRGGLGIHLCPVGRSWPQHARTYRLDWLEAVFVLFRARVLAIRMLVIGDHERQIAAIAALTTIAGYPSRMAFEAIVS